jgi:signal peptidase II
LADPRIFYFLALFTIGIDQLSKWLIIANIPLNTRSIPVAALYPYFQFTHIANWGTAFGFFQQNQRWYFGLAALLVALGISIYNHTAPIHSRALRIALGLIFGGALGNIIDRLRIGYVTDFLDFDISSLINVPLADWPVFNFADMAVVSGVIIIAYLSIRYPDAIPSPTFLEPNNRRKQVAEDIVRE